MYKVIATPEEVEKIKALEQMLMDFYRNPDASPFGQWLMGRLKVIVQTVGNGKVSGVCWGTYGGGSFQDPENNRITFDPGMLPFDVANLEKNLRIMFFVAGHEEGHDVITKYTDFIQDLLKKGDIKEGIEVLGLSALGNAIEDPRDNDWLQKVCRGSKPWVKDFYDPMFVKENTELFGQPQVLEKMKQALGYVPKFIKYTSEIIRFWHTGKCSSKLDKEVQSLIDKTRDAFVRAYQEQPKNLSDNEIYRSAKASFDIIIKEIWEGKNGYKELLEDARKLEESRQMLSDEDTQQEVLDQLTPQQMKELFDLIKQAMKQQQKQAQQPQQQGQMPNMPGMPGGGGGGGESQDDADDQSSQGGGSSGGGAGKTGKAQKGDNNQNQRKMIKLKSKMVRVALAQRKQMLMQPSRMEPELAEQVKLVRKMIKLEPKMVRVALAQRK